MNRHAGAHRHTYTLDWITNMADDEKYTKKRRFRVMYSGQRFVSWRRQRSMTEFLAQPLWWLSRLNYTVYSQWRRSANQNVLIPTRLKRVCA